MKSTIVPSKTLHSLIPSQSMDIYSHNHVLPPVQNCTFLCDTSVALIIIVQLSYCVQCVGQSKRAIIYKKKTQDDFLDTFWKCTKYQQRVFLSKWTYGWFSSQKHFSTLRKQVPKIRTIIRKPPWVKGSSMNADKCFWS